MRYTVTTTLTVNVPGDGPGREVARDRVANALARMVDPMNSGISIVAASVDRVVRENTVVIDKAATAA